MRARQFLRGRSLAEPGLGGKARSHGGELALSPPSERLWASHLALQTPAFLPFSAGRDRNLADAPDSGGERSARRASGNFVSSAEPGPRSAGAGAPSAGARRRRSSFPSTSRGPLGALPPTPRSRESNSQAGRAAEVAEEDQEEEAAGASRSCRHRSGGAGIPKRSL